MKTRLLGGIAALLVAIIGTVLLVSYVQNADKRALAGTETQTIYVVQKAIPAGTAADKIEASVIKKDVPKLALAANNVTDLASLGSKVTSVALMPGEQLLTSRMVEQNAFLGPSRVQVPTGLQEITLKLPIERVAGGKVNAGDTVGIFLSLEQATSTGANGQAGTKSSKTQLSFHKVLVTASQFSNGAAAKTEDSATASGTSQASSTTSTSQATSGVYLITIARNSADAERIVFAVEFGKVYLSKEPGDAVESGASFVDTSRLFR
ncbi:pilus assembly protein CpaB [Arthrobacter sp. ov407]|uniref:Flp pilus assembly protein CpaB n=1 Tax=Arthrobacter sp. ov407 TaxID=1761748 RepID=UPI00088A0E0C|nr:RcpC/CpaB family pilus assembly protein [Arthrobacter sp. ov407]SDK51715.1 pilus assembly protein CpaB [Arthrobacter sp. ov407]